MYGTSPHTTHVCAHELTRRAHIRTLFFLFSNRVGCMVLLHTRPTYAHMSSPGGLIYVPYRPGLVGHNVLHVT